MRLICWYCHKRVSSELPEHTVFRAIAVCPECLKDSVEAEDLQVELENKEKESK